MKNRSTGTAFFPSESDAAISSERFCFAEATLAKFLGPRQTFDGIKHIFLGNSEIAVLDNEFQNGIKNLERKILAP